MQAVEAWAKPTIHFGFDVEVETSSEVHRSVETEFGFEASATAAGEHTYAPDFEMPHTQAQMRHRIEASREVKLDMVFSARARYRADPWLTRPVGKDEAEEALKKLV